MKRLLSAVLLASALTGFAVGVEPDEAIKKKLTSISTKLDSKKADDQIAGLKAASDLKEDALSLMPKISKVMLSTNPKVAAQAAISIEQIDQNLYKLLMSVGTKSTDRMSGLRYISTLDEDRIALIQPVVDWLLPQFPPIITDQNGQMRIEHTESMIRILSKCPKLRTEFREYCLKTASTNSRNVPFTAAIEGIESLMVTATKEEKKSFATTLARLMSSESQVVRLAAIKALTKLPDQATPYVKEVEKIAAFDKYDEVRKAAGELLKMIDK